MPLNLPQILARADMTGVTIARQHDSLGGKPGADADIELGYGTEPAHRNRGYATEAAAALAAWGLAQPGVERVVSRCDPANAPSLRVLEKAGFVRRGEADGMLLWEWEPEASGL